MKPLVVVTVLFAAFLFAAPAQAAPERIAVVDMVELITKHPRAEKLNRDLDQAQKEAAGPDGQNCRAA